MNLLDPNSLIRVTASKLLQTVCSYTESKPLPCRNSALEIARRIGIGELRPEELKSLQKQINALQETYINPGIDIIFSAIAKKLPLNAIEKTLLAFDGTQVRLNVACAKVLTDLDSESGTSETKCILEKVNALSCENSNPGREIVKDYLISKLEIKELVAIITTPSETNATESKRACIELVRRAKELDRQKGEFTEAFRSIQMVAESVHIPGLEEIRAYLSQE